jgi:hypothetical protein
MVRAILAGRKTQTRRVVKLRGAESIDEHDAIGCFWPWSPEADDWAPCPYGRPGDRLWVRETWRPVASFPRRLEHYGRRMESVQYAADRALQTRPVAPGWRKPKAARAGNVSPLFMPHWAARLTLEVTGVRVERLQAISDEDAKAEGLRNHGGGEYANAWWPEHNGLALAGETAIEGFRLFWESINGADSWDANPWVWVVEFRPPGPRFTATAAPTP